MADLRDFVTVVTHLCRAYREIDRAHTRRLKQEQQREQQEKKRRERQDGVIDVEYRVIEE